MRTVIVGAGKLGFDLARVLSQEDHDVVVIDKDPEALAPIGDNFDVLVIHGNGASVKILEESAVKAADILLAVTDNDELNIIACMMAKQLGVQITVARVRNPDYVPSLPSTLSYHNFGIDLFLNPEYLAAQEIYRLIEVPSATAVEYFADGRLGLIVVKITENLAAIGKKIHELSLDTFTVVAVVRQGNVLIPDGNFQLLLGDKVYVLGKTGGLHHLNALMTVKKPRFNRIIMAGGGLASQYLFKLLQTRKKLPEITIIEPSLDQCRMLSRELQDCNIIQADATRMEVLEDENLGKGDIFVALTGSDNSNLVACMLAKKMNVSQIICEISREDYISLAETIGVTATITPRLLTVSMVLKSVKKKNVISLSLLNTGEAEILELATEPDAPVTQSLLKEVQLPAGVVIGSVIHDGKVVVPRGDTRIQTGDRVIIFTLREVASKAEAFFHTDGLNILGGSHAL